MGSSWYSLSVRENTSEKTIAEPYAREESWEGRMRRSPSRNNAPAGRARRTSDSGFYPVSCLTGPRTECFGLAADQGEVLLRPAKERGRFAAGSFLAVQAVTDRDEGWIGIGLELYVAAGAPSCIFLGQRHPFF